MKKKAAGQRQGDQSKIKRMRENIGRVMGGLWSLDLRKSRARTAGEGRVGGIKIRGMMKKARVPFRVLFKWR